MIPSVSLSWAVRRSLNAAAHTHTHTHCMYAHIETDTKKHRRVGWELGPRWVSGCIVPLGRGSEKVCPAWKAWGWGARHEIVTMVMDIIPNSLHLRFYSLNSDYYLHRTFSFRTNWKNFFLMTFYLYSFHLWGQPSLWEFFSASLWNY